MLERRHILAAAIGTDGEFTAGNMTAANAKYKIFNPRVNYNVGMFSRSPYRQSIGSIQDVPGARSVEITFNTEINGSGTAGVAPVIGPLLRASGFSETLNTGSAAIGTVVSNPANLTPASKPTVTGTFVGTKSGTAEIQIVALTTDTSIGFTVVFRPGDGTVGHYEAFSQTTADPEEGASGAIDGLLFDFGDPSSSTAGFQIGDRWTVKLTSDQQVDAVYSPISTAIPCLDIGLYQDGRRHAAHSCRGSVRLVASAIGQPMIAEWRFLGVTNGIPTDTALLSSIAYEDVIPEPFIGVTATYGGAAYQCFNNLSIDMGNEIVLRECATSATGYSSVVLGSRRVTGGINPLAALVATVDPWTDLFNGDTAAFAFAIGSTAGNIVEIDAPRVQITGIGQEERGGDIVDVQTLLFAEPEYDAGGDYAEIELTFR